MMEEQNQPAPPNEEIQSESRAQKKKKNRNTGLYAAISSLIFLFVVGILFYMRVEKWNFVDAFYFVGVTLTTIGYGDIYPKTDLGRIFTVFYAFMGVGTTLLILSIAAEHYFTRRVEQIIKSSPDKRMLEFTKGMKGMTLKIADGLLPDPIKPKHMQKKNKQK